MRVESCLAMYLGIAPLVRADPRQQPSFLYVPGLPIAPVFPRDALPFADAYEAHTDAITAELRALLDGGGAGVAAVSLRRARRATRRSFTTGGAWDAYFFFVDGERVDAHHAACPRTSAVLDSLPLDHVRDHGPEVCFSILRPGAHILPHRGVTNARARCCTWASRSPTAARSSCAASGEVTWRPRRVLLRSTTPTSTRRGIAAARRA